MVAPFKLQPRSSGRNHDGKPQLGQALMSGDHVRCGTGDQGQQGLAVYSAVKDLANMVGRL